MTRRERWKLVAWCTCVALVAGACGSSDLPVADPEEFEIVVPDDDSSDELVGECPDGLAPRFGLLAPRSLDDLSGVPHPGALLGLDLGAALDSVGQALFDEPNLDWVAVRVLCALFGQLAPSSASLSSRGVTGRIAAGEVRGAAAVLQADDVRFNPGTGRYELSGVLDGERSRGAAEASAGLTVEAWAPKCWDENGEVSGGARFGGTVERTKPDGSTETVEIDVSSRIMLGELWRQEWEVHFGDNALSATLTEEDHDYEVRMRTDSEAEAEDMGQFLVALGIQATVLAAGMIVHSNAEATRADYVFGTSDCLHIAVTPESAQLPPGESQTFGVTVTDWKGEPAVTVVTVTAQSGTVDPEAGASGSAPWAFTYHAPASSYDEDSILIKASWQGHHQRRQVTVIEPGGWSFSMDVRLDDAATASTISYQWEGSFRVTGSGSIDGAGIGFWDGVAGVRGACEENQPTKGDFAFTIGGTVVETAEGLVFRFDVAGEVTEMEVPTFSCGSSVWTEEILRGLVAGFRFLPEVPAIDGGQGSIPEMDGELVITVHRLAGES